MPPQNTRPQRRTDALSKQRIVDAAVEILDAGGDGALTFRALASRLSTGIGAIYWHIAHKDELLEAATDAVLAGPVAAAPIDAEPRDAIRVLTLGIFDAIDQHVWVGAQVSRQPAPTAMLRMYDRVAGQLDALGVPEQALFDTTSALISYVLGVASQNAENARVRVPHADRAAYLDSAAQRWEQLDSKQYPHLRRMSAQLRDHDDRAQFLAGVNLILAGLPQS